MDKLISSVGRWYMNFKKKKLKIIVKIIYYEIISQ